MKASMYRIFASQAAPTVVAMVAYGPKSPIFPRGWAHESALVRSAGSDRR
jgi:hypothetical protein